MAIFRQRSFRAILCLFLLPILAGCSWFRHHSKTAAAPSGPRLVGTVTMVNASLGFVLVDVGSLYTPSEGVALKSMSDNAETAVLVVSPERRRPFISADVVKGTPHVGDLVYE